MAQQILNILPSVKAVTTTLGMSHTLPPTRKVAVFKEKGQPLVIEEQPLKEPGVGEVLVKVEACGVCHSDTLGQYDVYGAGFPLIPGHEIIGRVAAVPAGEKRWKVGDRVGGGWHGGHDGTCKACNKGLMQMCENETINGVTRGGGYADYCTLNTEAAVSIPEHVDAAAYAPLLCAGVTTFNGIRRMQISPGELVAVQGLGGLGHLAIQYAAKMGYRVAALSSSGAKEKFARELGAHEYIDASKGDQGEALQKLGGAALIVVTAPNAKAIEPLMKGLGISGKLLVLAAAGEITVNTNTMIGKGLSVHSFPSGHSLDSEEAISFAQLTGVKCLIEKFPLDQANEAFNAMLKGTVRFRAVIVTE